MSRLTNYLKKVFNTIIIFVFIAVVLYALQYFFHLFDGAIDFINQDVTKVNSSLSAELLAGISLGTVVLVLFILFFPFFMKGINKKQYITSVYRGIISSFVFFISDLIYKYTENISRFYFFLSVVVVIMVTIVLIEILTLTSKKEKETEIRTDIVAAMAAGLVFGLVLKMVMFGIDYLKTFIKF